MNPRARWVALGAIGAALLLVVLRLRSRMEQPIEQSPPGPGRVSPAVQSVAPSNAADVAAPAPVVLPSPARLFERVLAMARETGSSHRLPDRFVGLFERESWGGFKEARLLALSFPEEVSVLASTLADDPTLPLEDRRLGLFMLDVLAEHGQHEAEASLFLLVQNQEKPLGEWAVEALGRADREGKYLDLYVRKALEGRRAAIEALSYGAHPGCEDALRRLRKLLPESDAIPSPRGDAETGLRRLDLLKDPEALAERLALRSTSSFDEDAPWLLVVARRGRVTGAVEALRRRLDWARTEAEVLHVRYRGQGPTSFEGRFAYVPDFFRNPKIDPHGDDALVLYQRLGGALTKLELLRLDNFGYTGNPRETLLSRFGELR